MEKSFVGGYWSERPESIEEITKKMLDFLNELMKIGGVFSVLRLPAGSKKKALNNQFEVNESSLKKHLTKKLKKGELNDDGFCKSGFSISLFNESNGVSLSIGCLVGASSKYYKNNLHVKLTGENFDEVTRRKILNLINKQFNPETLKSE